MMFLLLGGLACSGDSGSDGISSNVESAEHVETVATDLSLSDDDFHQNEIQ